MTTITIKGYIHARASYSQEAETNKVAGCDFHFMSLEDMSKYGYMLISEHTTTVEIPDDWDPRPQQVDALKAKLEKARDEFATLTMQINRQINELQALEFVA